jgi:hypothetical protein
MTWPDLKYALGTSATNSPPLVRIALGVSVLVICTPLHRPTASPGTRRIWNVNSLVIRVTLVMGDRPRLHSLERN